MTNTTAKYLKKIKYRLAKCCGNCIYFSENLSTPSYKSTYCSLHDNPVIGKCICKSFQMKKEVKLNNVKKALIIVDVQNDFLPGGSLAILDGLEIIPIINKIQKQFDLVVATQDWHSANHGSFAKNHEGKKIGDTTQLGSLSQILWPVHCVQDTFGACFHEDLNKVNIECAFIKGLDINIDSYSGFYDNNQTNSTGLAGYLKNKNITEVHIVGLATDYCVKFTALDSTKEGFNTYLIKDGCRGVNLIEGDVDKAIEEMKLAGVIII